MKINHKIDAIKKGIFFKFNYFFFKQYFLRIFGKIISFGNEICELILGVLKGKGGKEIYNF